MTALQPSTKQEPCQERTETATGFRPRRRVLMPQMVVDHCGRERGRRATRTAAKHLLPKRYNLRTCRSLNQQAGLAPRTGIGSNI
jgi:hypothetical protein